MSGLSKVGLLVFAALVSFAGATKAADPVLVYERCVTCRIQGVDVEYCATADTPLAACAAAKRACRGANGQPSLLCYEDVGPTCCVQPSPCNYVQPCQPAPCECVQTCQPRPRLLQRLRDKIGSRRPAKCGSVCVQVSSGCGCY